jgi:hypothetical protein
VFFFPAIRLPASRWFFVATALLYVVQWFPLAGIFLMMLGAILWPILLLNFGFIGIALEVFMKRIHWFWLVLPMLWFGGYFAFALMDHTAVARLQNEIALHNDTISFPFNVESDALILDGNRDATDLIEDYRLPVVFVKAPGKSSDNFNSARLADRSICDLIRFNPAFREAGFDMRSIRNRADRTNSLTFNQNLCVVWVPEKPAGKSMTVDKEPTEAKAGNLPVELSQLIVKSEANSQFQLLYGKARPLSWWPKPILGCGLNSGGASWDCFSEFGRDEVVLAAQKSRKYDVVPDLIADALGLEFTLPKERQTTSTPRMIELIQNSLTERGLEIDSSIFQDLENAREQ